MTGFGYRQGPDPLLGDGLAVIRKDYEQLHLTRLCEEARPPKLR